MTEAKKSTAKSTAKKSPAKAKKPKAPLQAYRCLHPNHIQTKPWATTVSAEAFKVAVTTTAKGGAESVQTYAPSCPACAKAAPKDAGVNRQNGEITVEVSEIS